MRNTPIPARATRHRLVTLLVLFSLTAFVPLALAQLRLVPQLSLSDLQPILLAFHPQDRNRFLVLNRHGRIDIFNMVDGTEVVKEYEIPAAHQIAAYSPDGTQILFADRTAKLHLWNLRKAAPACTPMVGHQGLITSEASPQTHKHVGLGIC